MQTSHLSLKSKTLKEDLELVFHNKTIQITQLDPSPIFCGRIGYKITITVNNVTYKYNVYSDEQLQTYTKNVIDYIYIIEKIRQQIPSTFQQINTYEYPEKYTSNDILPYFTQSEWALVFKLENEFIRIDIKNKQPFELTLHYKKEMQKTQNKNQYNISLCCSKQLIRFDIDDLMFELKTALNQIRTTTTTMLKN